MKKLILIGFTIFIASMAAYAIDKPDSHDKMWEYTHGMKAKLDISSCSACHANEKTCLDCHKATFNSKNKPGSHDGNYIIMHRLDAKRNAETCSTCHERGSDFCLKCHTVSGKSVNSANSIAPQSHKNGSQWVQGGLHGAYAKRNLAECQSCHPDLYTVSPCARCHGGAANISKNPHPANFSASKFKDLSVCYKCHGRGVDGVSAGPLKL